MSNDFVQYLNSLHNGSASNQNAIAEMQIASPYFASIQVKRRIVSFLKKKIENKEFVILTGHAGDGKTTLLAQVLEELGRSQSKLKDLDTVDCGFQFHYVKDFSELTRAEQIQELKQCFGFNGASLIIANTGPLLNAFKALTGKEGIESELLEAMDSSAGEEINITELGKVFILNIARIDNTDFIRPFISNLIADAHWTACKNCPASNNCPVLFNQQILKENTDRAISFIKNSYVWLQEYDRRATIRQITAHLTYAMTGGLSCHQIMKNAVPKLRYRYLFSNLFFGYVDNTPAKDAAQIRCITLVNSAGFDKKQTVVDYDLFNKTDYNLYFSAPVASLFTQILQGGNYISPENSQAVIKRAYLFFGQNSPEKNREQMKQTFSEWFDTYMDIRDRGMKPKDWLRKAICKSINALFVGEELDDSFPYINLTLRRNNEQTCNVQLLAGQINIDDVRLKVVPIKTISSASQWRLELQTGNVNFPIGLPLLNYFAEIHRGIIMTDIDPLLSNGIDSLKAQLLSNHAAHKEENEDEDEHAVRLIYMCGNQWRKRTLLISNHSVDHE